jgi:hypothetical protein
MLTAVTLIVHAITVMLSLSPLLSLLWLSWLFLPLVVVLIIYVHFTVGAVIVELAIQKYN